MNWGFVKLGPINRDHQANPIPPCSDTAMAYGWTSFDMEELEGQEAVNGRAGIMRLHNIDLRDRVLPLAAQGTVYVGVFQER